MKKKLFLLTALVVCLALLVYATGVSADFGGFSGDSDYGGGSDFGGGWFDSDSDYGGSFFDFGDSDFSGLSCTGLGCLGASCFGMPVGLIVFIILVILVIIAIRNRNKNGEGGGTVASSGGAPVQTSVQRTPDSELKSMSDYIASVDPGFSVSDMQTKLSNLYVQLQDNWCAKDISPLRPYLTDELYNQSERQLDQIRKANQTPHIVRIAVLGVNVRGWFNRDGMDHLIVELNTRITTYTTDDASGNIVRGDMNAEKFMTYEWDVARTEGQKTGEAKPMQAINCPNCGAPITINKSAKCPYCETVITLDEHDWVLYSIKGLVQRTQW